MMKRSESAGSCYENPDWSGVHSSDFSSITSTVSNSGHHRENVTSNSADVKRGWAWLSSLKPKTIPAISW